MTLVDRRQAEAEATRARALPQGLARLTDTLPRDRYYWPNGRFVWELVAAVRRYRIWTGTRWC